MFVIKYKKTFNTIFAIIIGLLLYMFAYVIKHDIGFMSKSLVEAECTNPISLDITKEILTHQNIGEFSADLTNSGSVIIRTRKLSQEELDAVKYIFTIGPGCKIIRLGNVLEIELLTNN